jgi:hypothetical protein
MPTAPKRDEEASLVQDARKRARNAKGAAGSVFTTALGDSNYGNNISRATLLGQSA